MNKERQLQTPFVDALEAYCYEGMVAFHTPGHKLGCGATAYQQGLFGYALRRDLGLMYALDDLFQPQGPLKEAMELAADLYGAGRTFFSINGTTACVEAMILTVCRPGDEIIIPREAHRCVMEGLILSGAVPVYMRSHFAAKEQVTLGPDLASLQAAIAAHPAAKAVLFTYPTYDGVACELEKMISYSHAHGLYVLVDEAHGAHLPFHLDLPKEALACGADMTAQSTHKLAGSITQTSMLHCRRGFPDMERAASAMALVQSTSPQYWLLASLDSARQQLALEGTKRIGRAMALARQLRDELNAIPGIYSFGRNIMKYNGVGGFDETKVTIDFSGLDLTGRQAEVLLRREKIEVELTAANHVLALITLGDTDASIAALLRACRRVAAGQVVRCDRIVTNELPLPDPQVVLSPRNAWNSSKEIVSIQHALGRIAAETIMFYPPGIPIMAPGEIVTASCIAYLQNKVKAGYTPYGAADSTLQTLQVLPRGTEYE
ncbi:MAG: aminotransferase class I/II-fold pyridoxal phosphate-dependent enzyme [Megasphaera sp.]|jgi:lysine decarboxylase|nr:aminotransferase class I/II-fold pyridoxal phosphate-dependent enzyme [Megasphaera sp.]MCH4188292.1 aminotransferase class I/II-fold pyridoxal phosphate-dependent enzyme [Megasphaera sp.]MCH4218409.1 aminotransferase class I/II-fold pyridoxal phosphate-dependent enzyme [Megasphaera sp.]